MGSDRVPFRKINTLISAVFRHSAIHPARRLQEEPAMSMTKRFALLVFVCLLLLPSAALAASAGDDPKLMEALKSSSEAYEAKDYAKVKTLLAPWAEKNDPTATFVLGLLNARGEGGPKDLKAAEKWWKRSADAGNPLAQFNLGYLYFKGAVGGQDYAKTRQYWSLAAKQGHPDALYGMGVLQVSGEGGPKDVQGGINNFKAAADKGHPMAQYELGQAYLNGVGVKQDKKKAKELLTKAAAKGMPEAKAALEAMGGGKPADKPAKKPSAKKPKQ